MTLVAGSPETLHRSARLLAARAEDLRSTGRTVRLRSEQAMQSWQGTASVHFAVRAGDAAGALTCAGDRLSRLAAETGRYAGQLDSAQRQARALGRQRDEARTELAKARLRVAQTATLEAGSPGLGAQQLVTEAQRRVTALERALTEVARGQESRARRLEDALRSLDPRCLVPPWMLDAVATGQSGRAAAQAVGRARLTAAYLACVRRGPGGDRADDVVARLGRARDAEDRLQEVVNGRAPRWRRVLSGPALEAARHTGRLSLAGTMADGAVDAATGGGYTGWRDPTTRVLGGAALVGGGTLLAAGGGFAVVAAPVTVPLAAAAVAGYTLWKAGSLAWDHRAQIARFGRRLWQGALSLWRLRQRFAARVSGAAWDVAGRAATGATAARDRMRQVRAAGIERATDAARRVRERATGLGDALREQVSQRAGQAARAVLAPIRLPLLPISVPVTLGW